MISLLNSYFVPVYVSNEDYGKDGSAPAEEKAERQRIYLEALKAKMSAGTVHVYITDPDGHAIDSQHVATASKVEQLTALLERTIARLKTPAGEPLVTPACQCTAPKADADALVLHLTARTLIRQGDEFVPVSRKLGETGSSGWGAYAAENWIVLNHDEWVRLLPASEVSVGTTWNMDKQALAKVLTYFYPSTENNEVAKNRIDEQTVKGAILSAQDGAVCARIDGRLRMKHTFYHKDDDNFVDATFVGIMDFDPSNKKIRSLQIVTDKASYGRTAFGVSVRSLP